MREAGSATTPMPPADPETAAELLLLLRIVLADSEADGRSAAALRRIALRDLGISEDGVDEVLSEIEHLVGAAGTGGALAALRELSAQRLSELAGLAGSVAARDWELAPERGRVEARVAALLGVSTPSP
ncbi:MAG: hypothetical protein KF849_09545 [Rhizobiaceae bacterium]|nr:hypothetical protein [Rhizobiaceae bacterium]